MLMSATVSPGVWKGGLPADRFRWALVHMQHRYLKHLFSPLSASQPYFSPRRAPTDGVWVGEQLCSEDVPVPVCEFEQLHILHRILSWKVGWPAMNSAVPVCLQWIKEGLCKVISFLDCQVSFLCPSQHWLWASCFSIYKLVRWLEKSWCLSDLICTFELIYFAAQSSLAFFWMNFTANVANLNLLRFAGRPGKYNKLFNRWRLEEVSADQKWSDHHLLF